MSYQPYRHRHSHCPRLEWFPQPSVTIDNEVEIIVQGNNDTVNVTENFGK
jgi:hypothetical protein